MINLSPRFVLVIYLDILLQMSVMNSWIINNYYLSNSRLLLIVCSAMTVSESYYT